jgi:phosphoribosylanthranilate isomerase
VFVEPPPELVVSAIRECDLTMLQFHGAEEPEFCRQFGVMTMKAFRIRNLDSLDPVEDYDADAILLDSFVAGKAGGTGQTFNWSLAFEARRFGRPIFLAGGLTPENVADAVRAARPFAVDVSSGVEEAPGKKDHGKMKAFISAVRAVGEV